MHQSTILTVLLLPFVSPMFLYDMFSATCIMDPGHDPLVKDITKIMDINLCEKDPPFLSAVGSVCGTVWASNWALTRVCPPPIKSSGFENGTEYSCGEISKAVNRLVVDCVKNSSQGIATGGRIDLVPSTRGYVVVRKPEPN
ncbi:hypothetical protein DFP73DRAFT_598500 [Morchella snyderi]|nr:hypothetical protein DFP73DRAFT_598500 [Morchella snyderi]